MSAVYFIRHGQTIWNVENKICGATDVELTELGHMQAEEAGRQIRERGIHFDRILYSPLERAADTARHISDAIDVPAYVDERLTEQSFGKYEATARDGQEFLHAKKEFLNHYDGGESMFEMAQRIYNLLDEITSDSQHTYLLVAHNGIARIVASYFSDMTNEDFALYSVENCELVKFER